MLGTGLGTRLPVHVSSHCLQEEHNRLVEVCTKLLRVRVSAKVASYVLCLIKAVLTRPKLDGSAKLPYKCLNSILLG